MRKLKLPNWIVCSLLALGMGSASAPAIEGQNLIPDGAFEEGIRGWATWNNDDTGKLVLSHGLEGAFEGKGCLLLQTTGNKAHGLAYYILPQPTGTLQVSGQARVKGAEVSKAVIGIQALDENNQQQAWETVAIIPNLDEWVEFATLIAVPEGRLINLVVSLEGEGEIRVDNLAVRPVE